MTWELYEGIYGERICGGRYTLFDKDESIRVFVNVGCMNPIRLARLLRETARVIYEVNCNSVISCEIDSDKEKLQ